MHIDLTTVAAAGVTAAVISAFQVLGVRYFTRTLDHIEKLLRAKNNEKPKE